MIVIRTAAYSWICVVLHWIFESMLEGAYLPIQHLRKCRWKRKFIQEIIILFHKYGFKNARKDNILSCEAKAVAGFFEHNVPLNIWKGPVFLTSEIHVFKHGNLETY